jgi:Flp pilus assembly pilin Flp
MLLSLYAKGTTLAWGMRDGIRARITNEDGAVATEYGLLLVLVALAIVVAATALGIAIGKVFSDGKTALENGTS